MSQIRRRQFGGIITDEELLYPDYIYYDVMTTEDNQSVGIGTYVASSRLVNVIIDGENAKSYASGTSSSVLIIPTAGYHKIYIKFQSCDSGHFPRLTAYSFVRLPNAEQDCSTYRIQVGSNPVTVININSSGTEIRYDGNTSSVLKAAEKIITPIGSKNNFISVNPEVKTTILFEKNLSNKTLNNLDVSNVNNL